MFLGSIGMYYGSAKSLPWLFVTSLFFATCGLNVAYAANNGLLPDVVGLEATGKVYLHKTCYFSILYLICFGLGKWCGCIQSSLW